MATISSDYDVDIHRPTNCTLVDGDKRIHLDINVFFHFNHHNPGTEAPLTADTVSFSTDAQLKGFK